MLLRERLGSRGKKGVFFFKADRRSAWEALGQDCFLAFSLLLLHGIPAKLERDAIGRRSDNMHSFGCFGSESRLSPRMWRKSRLRRGLIMTLTFRVTIYHRDCSSSEEKALLHCTRKFTSIFVHEQ